MTCLHIGLKESLSKLYVQWTLWHHQSRIYTQVSWHNIINYPYHSVYDYSWSKTLHQWEAGRKCKFFSLSRLKLTPYLSSYNSSKVFFLHIHPPQIFTHDLLHPIMNIFQVSFQVTFMRKFLRAINTGKWLIPCMTSVMQWELRGGWEMFSTHITII